MHLGAFISLCEFYTEYCKLLLVLLYISHVRSYVFVVLVSLQTNEISLRHPIADHPTWFEIRKGKDTLQLEVRNALSFYHKHS